MLYILAAIIILYTLSHFLFKKNEVYLRVRKYIDIAVIVVTSILVISWVEMFHYSFIFVVYFFISLTIIIYLIKKLRSVEEKRQKAETIIKELKVEETVLEDEIKSKDSEIKNLQK